MKVTQKLKLCQKSFVALVPGASNGVKLAHGLDEDKAVLGQGYG
jgi:hypothetical protein